MTLKSPSASPEFSVREFFARFPNDDACLAHLMEVRFGGTRFECTSCGKESTHHKLATRRTYVCANCGHQVNSIANTVLHDTPRHERQGTPVPAGRDLQDRLPDRAAKDVFRRKL